MIVEEKLKSQSRKIYEQLKIPVFTFHHSIIFLDQETIIHPDGKGKV